MTRPSLLISRLTILILLFFTLPALTSCTQTSVARLDTGTTHQPTSTVDILFEFPTRPHERIAILETRGEPNELLPSLIEKIKKEAMNTGADAIVLIDRSDRQTPQNLYFNPLLGTYQTLGGHTITNITGIAIKYN